MFMSSGVMVVVVVVVVVVEEEDGLKSSTSCRLAEDVPRWNGTGLADSMARKP